MRQILQSYRTGELWLAEVPTSSCKPGGVLVRTSHSLVSAGTERMVVELARKSLIQKALARPDQVRQVIKRVKSDGFRPTLEKVFAKLDQPFTMGYSASGTALEVGRDVGEFSPGDRLAVAGAGYATHAEFNWVPRNLCVRVPDGVSDADAAFATLGAIAIQGVRQARPELGERIVVVGLGLLGLLTLQILRANGCAVLGVDLDPERVALALELGADAAVSSDPEGACAAFTEGRGADAVILTAATSSNKPIESAAEMSRAKGRVVVVGVVGMDIPRDPFYRKELDLRLSMSYGPGRYDPSYEEAGHDYPIAYVRFTEQRNLESFLYLVSQGHVTPSKLVTHRFKFDDALDAYGVLTGDGKDGAAAEKPLGILLEYPADAPIERTVVLDAGAERNGKAARDVALGVGKDRVGLGFVGAGGFVNGVLLPVLKKLPDVRLTGVCTTSGMSASRTAERHGFEFATTELAQLLGSEDTHAVVVATTHASHARLACQALAAGKHVFVEKPLCLRGSEIADYESALATARAEGHQPCLMVGFNRRFSPHASALRETFAGRRTPMVVTYRVNAGRIPPEHWVQDPEVGGGRILGEVCHFVDTCSFLIGSPPVSVYASSIASDRRDVVAADSVLITIRHADGSQAQIAYLSEGSREMPKERCEVLADGKSAALDDYRTTEFFGARAALRGKQEKGFREELGAFLQAARRGGDRPIPWEELVATQRVCLAALDSLATGGPVAVA